MTTLRLYILAFFAAVLVMDSVASSAPIAITTHHYDTLRTGWNQNETTLNQTNVNQIKFGILKTVSFDDQVDAQPLLVPNQAIAGGTHDVVYVATASNTIYAIDASSGVILVSRKLGAPVPKPFGCPNSGPNVGITSTPVIDLSAQIIYVMAYLDKPQTYQLYALKLSDLTDKIAPVTVAASHKLTNGAIFTFNAVVQRQRAALLEANGNIYAGFASYCDFHADASRGWLLGWSASTLAPLGGNQLDDAQATSPTNFFLSSIWMSGSGIAAANSSLYFATGNSDCNFWVNPEQCPAHTTYDGVTNIQESVVGINPDLINQRRVYTPSNVATLDKNDADLGSGGVMLLPNPSGGGGGGGGTGLPPSFVAATHCSTPTFLTSATCSVPPGTANGDLMFAYVATESSTTPPTPPAGWTLLTCAVNTIQQACLYDRVAASEPASYTWTHVSYPEIIISDYRNATATISTITCTQTSSKSCTVPAISETPQSNEIYIGFADFNTAAATLTIPSGGTSRLIDHTQRSVATYDVALGSSVPVQTWSTSSAANYWDAISVTLSSGASGPHPLLAVAGGKDGRLFLLNRNNNQLSLLDTQNMSNCWCAPSFFTGPDQIGRIVSSGGSTLHTWLLELSPAPHLLSEATGTFSRSQQDPGFFTSVSSNGTTSGTGIIWAVGRPAATTSVTLYAFAAEAANGANKLLFSSPAGSWPNTGGNANIVPVVANGKVYVAANKLLTIFGILPGTAALTASQQSALALQPSPIASPDSPHIVTGALLAVNGKTLTLQTRGQKMVKIDDTLAVQKQQIGVLVIGAPITAEGSSYNPVGALQATSIYRAKGSSGALAPPDR